MSGHTPGPWHIRKDGFGVNGAERRIALICTNPDAAERGANASLIAAAPDLLSALKNATHELNDIRAADGAPRGVDRDYFGALVDSCFALIARSEGGA